MEPLSFDVIERLRVIFESRQYTVRHEHCSGYVVLADGTERYFTIINGLCTPQEVVKLFNVEGIAQVILSRVSGADRIEFVNIENHGFTR